MEVEIFDKLYNGLKMKEATYSEKNNLCVVYFLHNPELFKPDEDNKSQILQKLKDLVGDFVNFELNFKACPLDKRAIATHTYMTIMNNFPALSKNFTFDDVSVEINGMSVRVKLQLTPANYDYANSANRQELVENKLKESFLADFTVEFVKKEGQIEVGNAIESNMEFMESIKRVDDKTVFQLSDITNIIGKNDYSVAIDFSKINTQLENVVICGEITNVQKRSYMRKYTKNSETKEIEKQFLNFSLKNGNKFIYCSIFPRSQSEELSLDTIEVGLTVCCFGSFREFNGKLSFTASAIARCNFKKEEIKSDFKTVNAEYHTIFPEKYVDMEQADMFEQANKQMDETFVVFDLETTGLEATKNEIIEIGACKVVNGRIDQVFSTFVKPEKPIPQEITDLTHITNQMVENAPKIEYVLPDFYKFCHGSTMVGHNVAFDIGFVYNQAKKLAFNFDNPLMDTMEMARIKLPGLKNYKLGTVVEKLGIVLNGAHRAINDSIATAKVFIKLY